MDSTPRNQFNSKLLDRYWDIPLINPRATYLNIPIGTYYCDQLGYVCHPQKYVTQHGDYPNTETESQLFSLDYYNPRDTIENYSQCLSNNLVNDHYNNKFDNCMITPRIWNNTSKLYKYNQY